MLSLGLQKGFTLIEVMVSLVVLAIGLGALLVATTENIRTYRYLQQRIIQQWIDIQASNLLKLKLIRPKPSQAFSSSTNFLGNVCYWHVDVQATAIPSAYLAKISSRMDKTQSWTHHSLTYLYSNNIYE